MFKGTLRLELITVFLAAVFEVHSIHVSRLKNPVRYFHMHTTLTQTNLCKIIHSYNNSFKSTELPGDAVHKSLKMNQSKQPQNKWLWCMRPWWFKKRFAFWDT